MMIIIIIIIIIIVICIKTIKCRLKVNFVNFEIWGSHGGEDDDDLRFGAVYTRR
jgi:hypothetical protein